MPDSMKNNYLSSVISYPSSAASLLVVQKHKSVLEKLASADINNLTPIEAINLLSQIKDEMKKGT